ncbi:MAG: Ldh family oxidoreductase [Candidatus Delongbacteria bacterium]|nr:Ldh family oxidoreductase [Candidatus Delongbacteria bacterium]
MRYVRVDDARRFTEQVFCGLGVSTQDAVRCADILIASDLRGIESHGIGRLKMYYDRIRQGIQHAVTDIEVVRDRAAVGVWDGRHGMGQIIAYRAMDKAIQKASQYGLGAIAVRNSTHFGICGYYAQMAIDRDMIGLIVTNARPSVAPLFGVTPLLGTNPICFGAPSDMEYPFLFDAATSITQRGKIEQLEREELPTPAGWAIDYQGMDCTDTSKLLRDLLTQQAAFLALGGNSESMGGHKGYGLSTMVEILSAALQRGSFLTGLMGPESGIPKPYCLGHFFLAVNIDFFEDVPIFKKTVGDILRALKNAQPIPGNPPIRVAGEKEFNSTRKIKREGIPVTPKLDHNLKSMAQTLGITEL